MKNKLTCSLITVLALCYILACSVLTVSADTQSRAIMDSQEPGSEVRYVNRKQKQSDASG